MASEIVYRLATLEDKDIIVEFLREHFYPDEPLTVSLNVPQQDRYDEVFAITPLAHEPATCFIAMCEDQIVGTRLAGPKSLQKEKLMLDEASHIPGIEWAKVLKFLVVLEKNANVFEKYKVDKVMHGHALSVHGKFRRMGIAKKLMQKSVLRAKELGFPIFTSDCTNSYSARIAEQLGFECAHELRYADYRTPGSDEQVLFPPEDNQVVKTYALRL